jgi:hypothetical protein
VYRFCHVVCPCYPANAGVHIVGPFSPPQTRGGSPRPIDARLFGRNAALCETPVYVPPNFRSQVIPLGLRSPRGAWTDHSAKPGFDFREGELTTRDAHHEILDRLGRRGRS